MRSSSTALKLTYDDYCLFPDDGRRHEVMDGKHFVSPAPSVRHQKLVVRLCFALKRLLVSAPLGEVLVAPLDVVLSETDVVQPDLVYVSRENQGIVAAANIQGTPDLVVEVISDSTRRRDEELKGKLYERFGVLEYCLVDPDAGRISVRRRTDGRFTSVAELSAAAGDTLSSPLLPGLVVPLRELFA